MNKKSGIIYSDRYLDHDTGTHVECADRLIAIRRALEGASWNKELRWLEPRKAEISQIAAIHDIDYIEQIQRICERTTGLRYLNPDTAVSPQSYDVALLAAGGVLTGVDAVIGSSLDAFFALVRPPGHHAERGDPLGFCLFNNIAVGARYAQEQHGVERIFILDWDVHHGNGTMHSFEDDSTVFFASFHQYPHYPGTGRVSDVGKGDGTGFTLNFPMPSGSADADYLFLMEAIVATVIRKFQPQLLLISAGFDAHREDPLSGIMLTEGGYSAMMEIAASAAGLDCPVGLVLEGGYNLHTLSSSAAAVVETLLGHHAPYSAASAPSKFSIKLADDLRQNHPYLQHK
ncbi:MAG: histone deacetylase [bacterium]